MTRRSITFGLFAVLICAMFTGRAVAAPALTVEPISWNVIGLDSNDVTAGPARFLQGVRICNTGDEAATALTASFVWDTSNPYLTVEGPTTASFATVAPGDCVDAYFLVSVERDAAAYDTSRTYHVDVTADGGVSASAPAVPLYVEHLISQNRNDAISIEGPEVVYVGGTYRYTATSSTAPGGYEQLASFLDWPTSMFRIVDIDTSLTEPPGTVIDTTYADACGWDPVTRTCSGTGKAGGDIVTVYTVEVLGAGTATLRNLIYDFSGSSYHYNADYDADVPPRSSQITIESREPPDLAIAKDLSGPLIAGRSATYQLTVTNVGSSATVGPVTVTDELPAGVTFRAATADGWDCANAGGTVTCSTDGAIPAGGVALIGLEVDVALDAVDMVTNVATVETALDPEPDNDRATTTDPVLRPGLAIAKSAAPPDGTTVEPGGHVTYTITVSNPGTATTTGIVLTDPLPDGVRAVSATVDGSVVAIEELAAGLPLPDLPAGAVHTLSVTVEVMDRGSAEVVNTATVVADDLPATSSVVRHPVRSWATVSVTKDASTDQVAPGERITYAITTTNDGPHTARDVRVIDELPPGTSYVPGSLTVDGATVDDEGMDPFVTGLGLGDLAPGRIVAVMFEVDVDAGATGVLVNVARVTGAGEPAMDEAVTTVEEEPAADAGPDGGTAPGGQLPATGPEEDPGALFWTGFLSVLVGMLLVAGANAIEPSREVTSGR